ncbi:MAG TPA: phenylalanine--tRNA ligase subunit alpha, partial [Dehalococcoidia bacterium]|nr:phenylalanine--tRNA ligase subunit alpha [Dehalococcoidia bacterium]
MTSISHPISDIEASALQELEAATTGDALEAWRLKYLGRKGQLTQVLRGLTALALDKRRRLGAEANRLKLRLEEAYDAHRARLA